MRERQSYGEQARFFLWRWGCADRIKAGAAERETASPMDSPVEAGNDLRPEGAQHPTACARFPFAVGQDRSPEHFDHEALDEEMGTARGAGLMIELVLS